MTGLQLKEFRKVNQLTQIELSDYLGTTQGYLSQCEKVSSELSEKWYKLLSAHPTWDTSMLQSSSDNMESRLLRIIESQQETIRTQASIIENLSRGNFAATAVRCADAR